MENSEALKKIVKEKYSQIANQEKSFNAASCCGATPASDQVYNIMMDDYTGLHGYNSDADLGLGCGLPTAFAHIRQGDVVVDLGSGAGNDCFVARHEAGASGKIIGIDFAEPMIKRAKENAEKLGYDNVEFRYGDLEEIPVSDGSVDVVVSNCVLNLVPNKSKVFSEIFRILKHGGHFSISDVVLVGALPEALQKDAEMYAGCVAGAIQKEKYLEQIAQTGFSHITVQKEKAIVVPDDILSRYLSPEALLSFKEGATGIFSITVYAEKPSDTPSGSAKIRNVKPKGNISCTPDTGCC
ncbi:MAG TPA: arsenite methyltransferase [Cytophagales bacterium]|nr:arsenite methyltransferase [Cytophagales bacterium]